MKIHWQVRAGHRRLLVFFNGWGMDERLLALPGAPSGRDLLTVSDYSDFGGVDEVRAAVAEYESADLLAWSLGVWAAAALFGAEMGHFTSAVAVNGTFRPIDDKFGIPIDVFHSTLQGYSERSRDSFYRRMCGGPVGLEHFSRHYPGRDVDDQRQELAAICRKVGDRPSLEGRFTGAVIGKRDRIFPPGSQERFWLGTAPCRMADLPHLPFMPGWGWEELLGERDGP